ncbi:MAG: hypothetical protein DWQ47_14130 [Acidobacteria bacterium]|nr:MAG: hypothetical protein DWQ32_01530 [Acidobacteriota bacterium]REK02792.1 MAG: hypothetical protein DWQ38_10605 [Acidobacteriota bacterium]REK13403.1 MAG: hypothetical protein DWQ43_07220 [Acidobacteriota bacterium]REK41397.1 MAG: hypothetical protein DWQ47_14130 [Acidobacteriota bacterium]
MLIAILFTVAVSLGGGALTYLFAKDEGLLWRLCAGNVIGSVLFFFPAFLLASSGMCLDESAPLILIASLAVASVPLLLLKRKDIREEFRHEKDLARGKVQGATFAKLYRFIFYGCFALLFVFFFSRAMIVAADGIFTGGSQNLGDLPFHLGAIFGFSEGCNFPPQNPSFAGATFSYPFTADFLTALLVGIGADVANAMFVQNVVWAFSLLVIFERFVVKVTGDRFAGKIAVPILFFSGGFGFLWFLSDFWDGSQDLWAFIWNIGKDYTIGDEFRWGNAMVTLFITQRSLLLGMPLALIVTGFLWKNLTTESTENTEVRRAAGYRISPLLPAFVVGLLAGTLPIVHAHSLGVLFVVSACWFFFSLEKWKEWLAFGIGTALVALPELFWIVSGSASRGGEFIAWHFGFQAGDTNVVWFWLKNTGLFLPLLISAIAILAIDSFTDSDDEGEPDEKRSRVGKKNDPAIHDSRFLIREGSGLTYVLPFALLFVIANLFKLAPWEWDNIKVLVYWFAGSVPLVALFLVWFWRKSVLLKVFAALWFCVLIASGALDVWRTASGQIKNQVFDKQAVDLGNWARFYTEPDAMFLNAPTFNSAVVLSGRISVMRYPGHLSSHGIDYLPREADVKSIYAGAPDADGLIEKYRIDYILVSPAERSMLSVNEGFLGKFPIAHQEGEYRLYSVRSQKSEVRSQN